MECEEFRKLASAYVNHQLSQKKIQEIEEHLCICEICRNYLGRVLEELPKEFANDTSEKKKIEEEKEKFFVYTILAIAFLLFIFLLYLLLSYKS